jgi:NH3-dependent NAD+ synthetase
MSKALVESMLARAADNLSQTESNIHAAIMDPSTDKEIDLQDLSEALAKIGQVRWRISKVRRRIKARKP